MSDIIEEAKREAREIECARDREVAAYSELEQLSIQLVTSTNRAFIENQNKLLVDKSAEYCVEAMREINNRLRTWDGKGSLRITLHNKFYHGLGMNENVFSYLKKQLQPLKLYVYWKKSDSSVCPKLIISKTNILRYCRIINFSIAGFTVNIIHLVCYSQPEFVPVYVWCLFLIPISLIIYSLIILYRTMEG
jgi:hypothetical protein